MVTGWESCISAETITLQGGGGRVAIYYGEDETDAAFHESVTAKGGFYTDKPADDAYQGHDGSVYWHQVKGLMLILRG